MDSGFLTCPICYDEFNLTKHLARIIPTCGHTVCSRCLFSLLQNSNKTQRRCPIDSQLFSSDLNNIDAFKVNYVVNQILEAQSKLEFCKEHKEEMTFICFTDKKKICNTCVSDGGHQTHKIKGLKAVKAEANGYAKKVKEVLKNLDNCCAEAKQTSKEMRKLLLKKVKDEFEEMKKILVEKEHDLIYQINSTFDDQEKKMEDFLGASSEVTKSLEDKASELNNNSKSQEIFCDEQSIENLRQFFAKYNVEFDMDAIEEERDIIKDKIEDMFDVFKKTLRSEARFWSSLKFTLEEDIFKGLSRGVFRGIPLANIENNHNDIRMEMEGVSSLLKRQTQLSFDYEKEKLTISIKDMLQDDVPINISQWKNAKDVTIKVTNNILDEEDLQILNFVWRRLKAIGSLYIEIHSIGTAREILQVLAQTKTFSEIEIRVNKQDLTNEIEAAQSIGGILCATSVLRDLHLDFLGSKLSKLVLQGLLEERLSDSKTIEKFTLNLSETNVCDEDICHLPLNLSKLRYLWISLDNTRITDKTIGWLASKLAKLTKSLEGLAMYLNSTKITDVEMDNLFSKLGKIKRLTVDVARTNISNQTLAALGQAMCIFNDTIESFEIGLHNCDVGDEGLCCIFMSLPKVSKLNLILDSTDLTDRSIEELAHKTLSTTANLTCLQLNISNTEVNDIGIQHLFNNIGNLHRLELGLSLTAVSDDSVAPFIIDRILSMGNLTRFRMEVGGTQVSEEVQVKIKELQEVGKSEASVTESAACF